MPWGGEGGPCWHPGTLDGALLLLDSATVRPTRGNGERGSGSAGRTRLRGGLFPRFTRPAVPAGIGAIFTEGENQDHGREAGPHPSLPARCSRIQTQTWRQRSRSSPPEMLPVERHRAGRTRCRNKSLPHPPASKKTILRTRSLKMEYLWKPGSAGLSLI